MTVAQHRYTNEVPKLGCYHTLKLSKANVRCGSFSTEAAGSAARPTSASPRKLTSGPYDKLVAMGQRATSAYLLDHLVGGGEQR